MHVRHVPAFVVAAALTIPATVQAQRRSPAAGSTALGGEIGVYAATHDPLDTGLALEGFYEYYLDPRTSMRFGLGGADPEFENEEDSIRIVRIPFDIVYNWERGDVHPFVGAGIGAYILRLKDNGRSVGNSDSKLGATLCGGAEFFATRSTTVKAELRYHIIDDLRGIEPDGFSLTIGLKKYF